MSKDDVVITASRYDPETAEFLGTEQFVIKSNPLDPKDFEPTNPEKRDDVRKRMTENYEKGIALNKPVPDNPSGDDCGQAQMLRTLDQRLKTLFDADRIEQIAEALKRPNRGTDHVPNIGWGLINGGSETVSGAGFLMTTLAVAFVCLTVEIANRAELDFDFRQEIELDCSDQFSEYVEGCMENPEICPYLSDTITQLCSVSDVTQEMFVALSYNAEIINEISQEIVNRIQQDVENQQKITEDLFDNVIKAIENIVGDLTGSERRQIVDMMADATAAFITQIDINIANEVLTKLTAVQILRVSGVELSAVTQKMILDVTIDVFMGNSVMTEIDNNTTQTLRNLWETYVKSLDDYIRAFMGNIVALLVVVAIIAGIVIAFGIAATMGARALKGQQGKPGAKTPGVNASGTGAGTKTGATSGAIVPAT